MLSVFHHFAIFQQASRRRILKTPSAEEQSARAFMDGSPASASATDPSLRNMLFAACREGDAKQALASLQRTKAVNSVNAYGDTPLITACENDHLDLASALLKLSANIDVTDANEATAPWVATQKGHADVATLLLDHRANVDAANGK